MITISDKDCVKREATATGKIMLSKKSLDAIEGGTVRKGDVLEAAKIAGINAVKQTPALLVYCHQIPIEGVEFSFDVGEGYVSATCTVRVHAKTGVEMEALVGVSMALNTIWDMVKYLEKDKGGQYPHTSMGDIRVVKKKKEGFYG